MRFPLILTPTLLSLLVMAGCGGRHHDGFWVGPGAPVTAIATADLNRDGRLDVAFLVGADPGGPPTFAPATGTLVLRLGTGDPREPFRMPVRLLVGSEPRGLVPADLNGDGLVDLVVVEERPGAAGATGVTLLFNDPGRPGTFLAPVRVATPGRRVLDVAPGDLNGDGRPDLAIAAAGGKSALVAFQGVDGTFRAPVEVPVDGEPRAVAIGKLQPNLPQQELFVATTAGTLNVLLQAPSLPAGFEPARTFKAAEHPTAIVLGDFNQNGYLDVAVADSGEGMPGSPGSIRLLMQNAMILNSCVRCVAFDPPQSLPTRDGVTRALAAADLDGDGQLDLVAANAGLPGDPGSETVLLQVRGKPGTFLAPALYQGYWGPVSLAVGDLDGDGRPDLLVADGEARVRLQHPGMPGYFLPPLTLLR